MKRKEKIFEIFIIQIFPPPFRKRYRCEGVFKSVSNYIFKDKKLTFKVKIKKISKLYKFFKIISNRKGEYGLYFMLNLQQFNNITKHVKITITTIYTN